jgi:hypothetical protein
MRKAVARKRPTVDSRERVRLSHRIITRLLGHSAVQEDCPFTVMSQVPTLGGSFPLRASRRSGDRR